VPDRDYSKGTSPLEGEDRFVRLKSTPGQKVQNVTDENAHEVAGKPVDVHLYDKAGKRVLHHVMIPNTRERPDMIMFEGQPYEVVTTRTVPAKYRLCMMLEAERA